LLALEALDGLATRYTNRTTIEMAEIKEPYLARNLCRSNKKTRSNESINVLSEGLQEETKVQLNLVNGSF